MTASSTPAKARDGAGARGSDRRTILLVDDDRLILATLGAGLRDAGYEVLEATNGEAALVLVRERDPDIALLDMRMPGMSGLELARQLRAESDVPFLFLSAYGDSATVREAAAEGALGYLVKPVDVPQVLPTIESALARAEEIRALRRTESQLNTALASSREASMAIGILMERARVDRMQAFEILRDHSRSQRRKLSDVANELVDSTEAVNRVVQHQIPKRG